MKEIEICLQPKQVLFRKSIEEYPVTLYGGAKGGGKSYSLRNILLLRRFEYPSSNGVIFRRTYPELEANHIRPLFQEFPALREFWNESKKLLSIPNGSTLQFCHCANEVDIDLYQGREFHDLGIDEAGQWTESMFRKLQGSNRSSRPGIKARTITTGNPGGIGHAWLKRIFIERRFNDRERAQDYNFIQALVDDNPALIENDPDYVHRLNTEPNEALRKAYRYGDWDIFAGQYFGELRREIHVIKPFQIPDHWTRFGAYDFGFNHPAAFGWFACDEDGNVYLYRELVLAQQRIDQFAQKLKRYPDTEKLLPIVAGHDCWAKKAILKSGTPPTIAEEFINHDIILSRAKIDRVQGATQLRNYLAWQDKPNGKPRFFIFETCPVSFDTLTRMQIDPDYPEDVLKQDATDGNPLSGDDCFTAGTLIATARGQKPIEDIIPGDLVWTRAGLKPVVDSWLNGINSQTIKLTLSDGTEVTATPNHRFWTKKGFVPLDTLRYGDRLECLNQKLLYSKESSLGAIPYLRGDTLERTSGLRGITAKEVWALCMLRYGKRIMAASRKGGTFITPMGIHSTTRWKTWCRSILALIAESISKTQSDALKLKSILRELDHWLVPGIGAPLVASGTARMLNASWLNEKGSGHLVWSVPELFIQSLQKKLNFAATTVGQGTEERPFARHERARCAEKNLAFTETERLSQKPAHIYVEQLSDSARSDTYSLHVKDCHEYFANGVLVANCYDMIRYGLMSRPAIADQLVIKLHPGSDAYNKKQAEEMEEVALKAIQPEEEQWGDMGMEWN